MNWRTRTLFVLSIFAVAGCVKEGESTDEDEMDDMGIEQPDRGPQLIDAERNDMAQPTDAGDDDDLGPDAAMDAPDVGVPDEGVTDMMMMVDPDMGAPDMSTMIEVNDCASACRRYAQCDRDQDQFGGQEECLAECNRLTRNGPEGAAVWWDCIEVEECGLLHLCPLPQVEPLSCAEVCQLTSDCAVDIDFVDCETECERQDGRFQTCAEALFGECGNDEFMGCLAREVYDGCQGFCDAAVGCNVLRPDGCVRQCVGRLASGDPLAAVNQNRTLQCANLAAMDCGVMDDCVQPYQFGPEPPITTAQFCGIYNTCNFLGAIDCEQMYNRLEPRGAEALRCFMDGLSVCPDRTFELEDFCEGSRERVVADGCARFCSARNACGDLDGDAGEVAACTTQCAEGFTDDPDLNERLSGQIVCSAASSCAEFEACRGTASPEGQCQRFCATLDGCGLGAENCIGACDENWPRDRHALYRACVAEAGDDCDAAAECQLRPTVPCGPACDRIAECGGAGPRCAEGCDDAHVADPVTIALQVGCVLSAAVCAPEGDALSVQACLDDPEAAGRACLNYCRAEGQCDVAADLSECLTQCVGGYADREALRYAAAVGCLEAAPSDAPCEALDACFNNEIAVDCEGYCQALDDCTVPAEDCLAQCADAPDADSAGCIMDALRTGRECRGVAQCVGYDPEPAGPDCARTCEIREECDHTVDAFLCERQCTPTPPALPIRLACLEASVCGEEDGCLELGPEPIRDCQEPCATALACGAFDNDLNRCLATCTGQQATPRGETYIDRLVACLFTARDAEPCDTELAASCFSPILCTALPDVLVIGPAGGVVEYNTRNRESAGASPGCRGGGPQQVVVISVAARQRVTMSIIEADYDPMIHLRGECDDPASELFCNDDSNGLNSEISEILDPGTYFLYLDGWNGGSGSGTLRVLMGAGGGGDNPPQPPPVPGPEPQPPG